MIRRGDDDGATSGRLIFDTTLARRRAVARRSMTADEKLEMARCTGATSASTSSRPAFPPLRRATSRRCKRSPSECRAPVDRRARPRATRGDIERAGDARQGAPTSAHPHVPRHLGHSPASTSCKMTPRASVSQRGRRLRRALAKRFASDVEFSPRGRDAHRLRISWSRSATRRSRPGATTLNIPDTVGYTTPDEYATLIALLQANVPRHRRCVISVHCHNDLGLAVANTLAGVAGGRAPDRVHDQRHRRARRQLRARRGRDGAATRGDQFGGRHRHRHATSSCRPAACSSQHHRHRGAAQQGDRRRQRVRPRGRHPSGRHAQEPRHLRDHEPEGRGLATGPNLVLGKAFRPARVSIALPKLGVPADDEQI